MSTQTLSSVAIDVVDQYNLVGKQLVRAWRAGTERAVVATNERFASALNARPLPLVNDHVKASLIDAQQQVAGLVSFGLSLPANGADMTIDRVARRVHTGIERLSNTATRVEAAFGTAALGKVTLFALPVAQVSLSLANAVAEGSKRLTERVAGADEAVVAAPATKAAKKPAQRRTRRA